mgnify:CR=1 FL=1
MKCMLSICALGSLGLATAQQAGTKSVEGAPRISLRECGEAGCSTTERSMTLDANWRWVHDAKGYENCYKGKEWVDNSARTLRSVPRIVRSRQ